MYLECPICRTSVKEDDFKELYISPLNGQDYRRYECPSCLTFWWEPLRMIPEMYEGEVFENYEAFHVGMRFEPENNHRAFFENFPKGVRGRLLDVGCGDGLFLLHARDLGFDVWGVDFDERSVSAARKRLGLESLYAMTFEDFYRFAIDRGLNFDVITFFEVLEHQDRPREFLAMVKGLLREGGYIAGSVPNRESLFVKKFHRDPKCYIDYPPHHFLRFSQASLRRALELSGFRDLEVVQLDVDLKDLFWLTERVVFGDLTRLKKRLWRAVVGDEGLAILTVNDIKRSVSGGLGVRFLKLLRLLRNAVVLPFAIPYIGKLKGNGLSLYFQGRV